uniref:Uncharacterized protein n=1 Tax=Arundo donax TaxID=35708 RepID=A0A0A8YRL9_ARUDO
MHHTNGGVLIDEYGVTKKRTQSMMKLVRGKNGTNREKLH